MIIYPQLHLLQSSYTNVYLLESDDGYILVDTGLPEKGDLLGYLDDNQIDPTQIEHILLTNADVHHVGNLEAVQEATGATVYASQATADLIAQGRTPNRSSGLMGWVTSNLSPKTPINLPHLTIVQEGDVLPIAGGIHVFETQGYSADQVAYHLPAQGIVFTGDALHSRNQKLGIFPTRISANIAQAKQSAIQLLNLAPVIFACGQGQPYQHSFEDVMMLFNHLRE